MNQPAAFPEAERAMQRGDRDSAYTLLRQALIQDPGYVPAWLAISRLIPDPLRQRECLQQALALDPANRVARERLDLLRLQQLMRSPAPGAGRSQQTNQLGALLIERGLLTLDQLDEVLGDQRRRRRRGDIRQLGALLVARGWVTPVALARVLIAQQQDQRRMLVAGDVPPLGAYLLAHQLISTLQLEAALEEQIQRHQAGQDLPLGGILVRQQALAPAQLQAALQRQHQARASWAA